MVELMVAMLIMAVVTTQALGVLSSQIQTFHSQKRVLETQEDARLVADMILVDLRMAGFMTPKRSGVSSVDGGVNQPDSLCVSEWTTFNETELENASNIFDRASPTGDVTGSTVTVLTADMDMDADGDDDFIVGEGIIIADTDNSHCAVITAIAGGTITFAPATAATIVALDGARAVPAIVYQVAATGLTRNSLLLSSQVEDLQVEYAIDLNDDDLIGAGEFPIHTLTANNDDTEAIRGVRLSVLTRTVSPDTQLTGAGRQVIANRTTPAAADNFRRRLVTVNAAPRNLL
jgi:Tfp pilus assembly protein PilW